MRHLFIFNPFKHSVLSNNVDPDETPRNAVSNPSLHYSLERYNILCLNLLKHNWPDTPYVKNGIVEMIRLDESVQLKWVKNK